MAGLGNHAALRQRSLAGARRYSCRRTAELTAEVYLEAADRR
jgi:hypothetical protein